MSVNYELAWESIAQAEQSEFWKPLDGYYEVKFLSELEEFDVEYNGEVKRRAKVDIELITPDGTEQMKWSFPVGKTFRSVYGQIVFLGKTIGKLTGVTTGVSVKTSKKNFEGRDVIVRDFTVLKALKLKEKGTVKEEEIK